MESYEVELNGRTYTGTIYIYFCLGSWLSYSNKHLMFLFESQEHFSGPS